MLANRGLHWLKAEDVALQAATEVWARAQATDVRSFDAYARTMLRHVVLDLQWGDKRKSRSKWAPAGRSDFVLAAELLPPEERDGRPRLAKRSDTLARLPPSAEELNDEAPAAEDQAQEPIYIDEIRRSLGRWLPTARRGGDRDARFGDPVEQATALLYQLMFSLHPLSSSFWPSGFPEPDDRTSTADLHLSAALWLTDRDWFPASELGETERKRVTRAEKAIQGLAHALSSTEVGREVGGEP